MQWPIIVRREPVEVENVTATVDHRAGHAAIQLYDCPSVNLRNVTLLGLSSIPRDANFYGIWMERCQNVTLENVIIQGFPQAGIEFIACKNIVAEDCCITDTRSGMSFSYLDEWQEPVVLKRIRTVSMREGNGIHGTLRRGWIEDHAPAGWHSGTIKLSLSQDVTIVGGRSGGIMLQGTHYHDVKDNRYYNHPRFPGGVDWRDSSGIQMLGIDFRQNFRFYDQLDGTRPPTTSATKCVTLSYPMHDIRMHGCQWRPGLYDYDVDAWHEAHVTLSGVQEGLSYRTGNGGTITDLRGLPAPQANS